LRRKFSIEVGSLPLTMTITEVIESIERAEGGCANAGLPPGPGSQAVPSARYDSEVVRSSQSTDRLDKFAGHGVDIEEIESLPPWPAPEMKGSFYGDHFTPAELANAGSRALPRAHLCGIWCAKEAVKKCAPELMEMRWLDIEVSAREDGLPLVRLTPSASTSWRFSLSISHSGTCAIASVLAWRT
jgi:holo-[acyl-carrier protein] synthase